MVKIKILEREKIKASLKRVVIPGEYTPMYQSKTVTPTKNEQFVKADPDYDALKSVTVKPIPSEYIKPEGSMDINENGTFDVREKAEVDVQVVAKPKKPYIDSSLMTDFRWMFSPMWNGNKNYSRQPLDLSLLQTLDTSKGIYFSGMFQNRNAEYEDKNFEIPLLDTSNGIDFDSMFYNSRIGVVSQLDLSNAINCRSMFFNAYWVTEVPYFNTAKCTNFSTMFFQATVLKTVGGLNTENGENFNQMFCTCGNIITIGGELDFGKATNVIHAFQNCINLREVRFKAIRVFDNNLNFSKASKLTVESLLSILNALSDNTAIATTYTVTLGTENLEKLTEEQKEIAYSKNIALA